MTKRKGDREMRTYKITWETMDGTVKATYYKAESRAAAVAMLIEDQGEWLANIL